MLSKHLKYCVEERKTEKEIQEFPKIQQKMFDEKLITLVQVCIRCGRKFPFKKGRKSCPYCQGLLRTNTMMLKAPQF
jgi:rubrerythrin